jgi:hypothetical protein
MSTTWKPLRSELRKSIKEREWEKEKENLWKKEVTANCKPVSESSRAGQWKHNPALIQNTRYPGWNPNITVENMCRTEGEGSTFL